MNAKFKEKKHCSTPHLTEDEIKANFVRAANRLGTDRNLVLKELREIQWTLHFFGWGVLFCCGGTVNQHRSLLQ
ncbi:MAG TPA: hypothetical protein IAA26_11730 [Candidatus Blautia faecipullorum]|nr:hypothetical protein [Candidatus Blautia faecipullorum]